MLVKCRFQVSAIHKSFCAFFFQVYSILQLQRSSISTVSLAALNFYKKKKAAMISRDKRRRENYFLKEKLDKK